MLEPQVLDRRIRQMHAALDSLKSEDLSAISVDRRNDGVSMYVAVDFGGGLSEAEVYQRAETLVANIARLKDHLRQWCNQCNVPFTGEQLINTNRSVALVHDLWNSDKHAVLERPPRSGSRPRLVGLRQRMSLSTGSAPSSVAVIIDPLTGTARTHITGGAKAELAIDGEIVDEHGAVLGRFSAICEDAVNAWEQALAAVGVNVPPR